MAGDWLVVGMVWVAGLCSWVATLVSLGAAWSHCKNYSQPNLQRWVVRIIMMVPVYALTAWATLISVDSAYYLDTVRDIYEAFVIYCFVSLLIAYFGGERAFLLAMHDCDPTPLFWPASLVRKDLDLSDPYDYLFLKRGILQYVVVKPILAAAIMLLKSLDMYHDGNWAMADGYLWMQLVYNASVSLSLYCLVVFYMATRESLAPWNPLPKFLCVKAIVFFSYWQGLAISILVGIGLIHDTPTLSASHIAAFLQSWLICLEMIGGALGHWISFSYLDYVPSFRLAGRVRLFHAVRDAAGFKDVLIDARNAWSGHQYTYKFFDPTVPVDELDVQRPLPARQRAPPPPPPANSDDLSAHGTEVPSASSSDAADGSLPDADGADGGGALPSSSMAASTIKERRLRAGMRYTQGGKKTYWLPVEPVDHRAVSFAAGGAGRTRAALLHGAHPGTSVAASVKYIGSATHSSSRAVHESRRIHKHTVAAGRHLPEDDAGPTEYTSLIARPLGGLSELSMDIDTAELALDDALFAEARGVDGDFNYPVMEIGVAVGYARRRPYGNTLPRRSSAASSTRPPAGARPRLQNDHFTTTHV